MSYSVPFSDSSKPSIVIPEKEINITTDLALIGKNVYDYGQPVATNFLHLLENFSAPQPPISPTEGQVWYKSDDENFYYYDGVEWKHMPGNMFRLMKLLDTDTQDQIVTGLLDQGVLVGVISSVEFDLVNPQPDGYGAAYEDFNDILNGGGTIKAGITLRDGMMFHGTATSAQYADLAEMYMGDKSYEKGTVMKLGGTAEVTQTTSPYCDNVFGIVSSDPAYLMNSALSGTPIALEGRVPCKVVGKVQKGDRLVASDIPGVAMVAESDKITWMNQVGRALEDKETEEVGLIEVVVGAK